MTNQYMAGFDTSNNNPYVDVSMAHYEGGKAFHFMKATEGNYFKDATFDSRWKLTRSLGMVRGAYHYLIPTINGADQADYLHAMVRDSGHFVFGDAFICDLEDANGASAEQVIESLKAFMLRGKQQIAKQGIIYTAPYFWQGILGDPTIHELAEFPLWLADWGPNLQTLNTWPTGAAFWQYDGFGHCPGVSGYCDLDRFLGDWRQLQRIMRPPWAR